MSLNVLNMRFIALLRQLGLDVDQFADKTFDGLFESKHSDLNYFLEWFVKNISSENVLTEAESDLYDICRGDVFDGDEEIDDVPECQGAYQDLESVNEDYVSLLLVEFERLDDEFKQLEVVNLDFEKKESYLKKKPKSLREEWNGWRRRMDEVKEQIQSLDLRWNAFETGASSFRWSRDTCSEYVSKLRGMINDEEELGRRLEAEDVGNSLESGSSVKSVAKEVLRLKTHLKTSKHLLVISKCLLDEMKLKVLKAEELLDKLEKEGEDFVSFDEVLSACCEWKELDAYENLKKEVDYTLPDSVSTKVDKEYELIRHRLLSRSLSFNFSRIKEDIRILMLILDHVKWGLSDNILLFQVMKKSVANEKECWRLIEDLYFSLEYSAKTIKSAVDSLGWNQRRFRDVSSRMYESNALLLSCKEIRLASEGKCLGDISLNRACDRVGPLLEDPSFYSESVVNELEFLISAAVSNVTRGPTSQINFSPISLVLEFSKCEGFFAELSHSVQRLLTDYMNTKASFRSLVSSGVHHAIGTFPFLRRDNVKSPDYNIIDVLLGLRLIGQSDTVTICGACRNSSCPV